MEVAYFAGLFDGEGTIVIAKGKNNTGTYGYWLQITIQMVYKDTLVEICKHFGGSFYPNIGKEKQISIWTCRGIEAGKKLKLLFPFLREKKEQAELALQFLEDLGYEKRGINYRTQLEKEMQENYYQMMKLLKVKNKLYNRIKEESEEFEIEEN